MNLLRGKPPLKSIVFDMDGVLFHSAKTHASAFRKALAGTGVKHFDYKRIAGMRTPDAMRQIFSSEKKSCSPRQIAALTKLKQALAYRLLARNPPVAPGCRSVLEKLSKHYRLALVSSSRRKNVALFLKASGAKRFFSLIMAGEDLPRSKPSPLVYKTVLSRLKVKSNEVLVIEDSLQGVRSAVRARLRVIGVKGDTSGRLLLRAGARRVIGDIRELRMR